MISASDYSQRLNISRVKIFNESFFQNIKINKCNLNERNENIKNRIKDDRSNKNLFKLI